MKKTTAVVSAVSAVVVIIVTALIIVAAVTEKKQGYDYYYEQPIAYKTTETSPTSDQDDEEYVQLNKETLDTCQGIYNTIIQYYNLSNPMPAFYATHTYMKGESAIYGHYDREKNVIFVSEDVDDKEMFIAVVAHEICHYLVNKEEFAGYGYMVEDYTFGTQLEEGCTNYISTKVYPFPKGTCVYEYETHCAEILANAYGEEKFVEDYFNHDFQSIRDDFNTALKDVYPDCDGTEYVPIKMTTFDVFAGNLELYNACLNISDTNGLRMCANSCEEQLLKYSQQKGKDSTKYTRLLIDNQYMIPWSRVTDFNKIMEKV